MIPEPGKFYRVTDALGATFIGKFIERTAGDLRFERLIGRCVWEIGQAFPRFVSATQGLLVLEELDRDNFSYWDIEDRVTINQEGRGLLWRCPYCLELQHDYHEDTSNPICCLCDRDWEWDDILTDAEIEVLFGKRS